MITDINSEDRLVQKTFADHLETMHGWLNVYAWNDETFGPNGTLGRKNEREIVLVRELESAILRLNPELPAEARNDALLKLTALISPVHLFNTISNFTNTFVVAFLLTGAMRTEAKSMHRQK
jgi:hypothetical protein